MTARHNWKIVIWHKYK